MDNLAQYLIGFCLHRLTRYVLAWLVALASAILTLYYSWTAFDDPRRGDGNEGHVTIDFGGQWLMGAMLVRGHGQDLYNRSQQWIVLREAYATENEVPLAQRRANESPRHDFEQLMSWFMGRDDFEAALTVAGLTAPLAADGAPSATVFLQAGQSEWQAERLQRTTASWVGGPLYPPVNALYYAPLGALSPQVAYRTFQVFGLLLGFLAALGLSQLSERRIWWPVAVVALMIYPGFGSNLKLGQNAVVSLTILVWGWGLLARGRQLAGGLAWGLLAFKPVWAAAFFLVPLLTGRWRMCLGMIASGSALVAFTLPLVGWHSWLHWLEIGRDAAKLYNVDHNWVFLSRDLWGIPRRFLLDFNLPSSERDVPLTSCFGISLERYGLRLSVAGWIGVALLATAGGLLALAALVGRRQAKRVTGPPAAFLLLGAWLCCFHFMYYDVLLTALPVFLLFTEPRRYLEPRFLAIVPLTASDLGEAVTEPYRPVLDPPYPAPFRLVLPGQRYLWVLNSMTLYLVLLLLAVEHLFPTLRFAGTLTLSVTAAFPDPWQAQSSFQVTMAQYVDGQPWDLYCLILIWFWCGWLWLRDRNGTRGA
jgi:hypothetical protein